MLEGVTVSEPFPHWHECQMLRHIGEEEAEEKAYEEEENEK